MAAIIVLIIYVIGVWVAYFQLCRWSDASDYDEDGYQILFMLSTLSWAVYPIYGIIWILDKVKED